MTENVPMQNPVGAIDVLAEGVRDTHRWFEATLSDVTTEQAHALPAGMANPIAAVYAHVIVGADFGLHTALQSRPPILFTEWNGKHGLSAVMPLGDWHGWATSVRVDLDQFRAYARDVLDRWDTYLDAITPHDLTRVVELPMMGARTLPQFLRMQIQHFSGHWGEVACLKGLTGAVGYQPGTPEGIG